MHRIFSIYHPLVVFSYITSALVFTMLNSNPVYTIISFILASIYSIFLLGSRSYFSNLKFGLLIFFFVGLANPLFNSLGRTVLFYTPWNNPFTLEALIYGLNSGLMLLSVFIWFSCYNILIDNSKFIYIFGRLLPTTALMLSMVMRWIPLSKKKLEDIVRAQKALGLYGGENKKEKLEQAVRVSSILMSWSMEDSIVTAESMKARGYGSGKRSFYHDYKWNLHDIISMFFLAFLIVLNALIVFKALPSFDYYPLLTWGVFTKKHLLGYTAYGLLLAYPLILEIKEGVLWTLSKY